MNPPVIEKRIQDYELDGWVGHFDERGQLEFGDGALRLSQYTISKYLLASSDDERFSIKYEFSKKSRSLCSGPEPVRHTDSTRWYGQPGTMSRDNLMGLVDAAAIVGDLDTLVYYYGALKSRWFFAWNTKHIHSTIGWKVPDWCGFDCWRRMNPGWPYSKRLACDLALIPPTIVRVVVGFISPNHTSPDQTGVLGFLNRRTSPTFASRFCEWIYFTFRDWKSALKSYFNPVENPKSAPPLDGFLIRAIET